MYTSGVDSGNDDMQKTNEIETLKCQAECESLKIQLKQSLETKREVEDELVRLRGEHQQLWDHERRLNHEINHLLAVVRLLACRGEPPEEGV